MSQVPVIPARSLLRALRVCGPVWLGLGLVCGCAGGQTGTEDPVPGEGGEQCEVVSRSLMPDDRSALGFSANDVLAWAVGEHTSTLLWEAPPELRELSPEQGQQGLTLALGAAPEAPSLLHYTPRTPGGTSGDEPAVGILCPPDELSIPVTVKLTSAGGALDESFAVDLHASHARLARFSKRLNLADLGGRLQIVPQGSAVASVVQLDAAVYPGGTSGTLSGQLELGSSGTRDGVSGASFLVYARWPLGASCVPTHGQGSVAVPLTSAFDGVSGADMLLAANGLDATPLTWNGGGATHLTWTLAASTTFACASVGGALSPRGVSLDIPVQIVLETADERLAARLPGQLTTVADSAGAPGNFKLSGSLLCDSGERGTWATACGMPDLALTDQDGLMLRFDATVTLAAPTGTFGWVEAFAARRPSCPSPTEPCSGIQWESLVRGDLRK